jgi:flagellar basal body-associated protein FliL
MEENRIYGIKEEKKSNNKFLLILLIIVLMGVSFGCGYFINNSNENESNEKESNKNDSKDNTNSVVDNKSTDSTSTDEDNKNEKTETQIDNIAVTDKFAVNMYGGTLRFYIISNGKVYYKISNKSFAGLNVCPSTDEYCKDNKDYNNNVTEVSKIDKAIKIKTVKDLRASSESFVYFVISDNEVYEMHETMDMDGKLDGVRVEVVKTLSNKNVVDLIGIDDEKYTFVTSSGEQIKY